MKSSMCHKRITAVLFVIYLAILGWILLLKLGVSFSYMSERRTNLIPFSHGNILTSENILNVFIFVPFGIYAGALWKEWNSYKKLLLTVFSVLVIEALQYMLRIGAFDVTDIVTNTLGGVIGLFLFKVIDVVFRSQTRTQQVINWMAASGTVLMVLFLILLKMNLLPIRYQ